MGVGDDDCDVMSCNSSNLLPDGLRGKVGVSGQQSHVSFSLNVGSVDAGVCTDEAVLSFCDEVAVAHAHDALRLSKYDFDEGRVLLVLFSDFLSEFGRLNLVEVHGVSFCTRNDDMCEHEYVAILDGSALSLGCNAHEFAQSVSFFYYWQAFNCDYLNWVQEKRLRNR